MSFIKINNGSWINKDQIKKTIFNRRENNEFY